MADNNEDELVGLRIMVAPEMRLAFREHAGGFRGGAAEYFAKLIMNDLERRYGERGVDVLEGYTIRLKMEARVKSEQAAMEALLTQAGLEENKTQPPNVEQARDFKPK